MLSFSLLFAVPGIALALAGEWRGSRLGVLLGKGVASAGFVVLAVSLMPPPPSPCASWILAALAFSFAGDLALVWRTAFVGGLSAFLLAHLAYAGAFASRLSIREWPIALGAAIVLVSIGVLAFLWPRLERMKPAVTIYVLALSLMLWGGVSTWWASSTRGTSYMAVAAGLFYVSDVFVARQTFIRKSLVNPTLGLPLYYAAQYLFASAVALII